jgi:hypothetical protein
MKPAGASTKDQTLLPDIKVVAEHRAAAAAKNSTSSGSGRQWK